MSGRRRRSPELDERTHELTDEVLDRSE
jgi:hypothetical protein